MQSSTKIRSSSLSISSSSSKLSISSSRDFSPHASPRRGLLANHSPPLSPTLSQLDDYIEDEKAGKQYRTPCLSKRTAFSILLMLCGAFLLLNSFVADFRGAKSANFGLTGQAHLPDEPSVVRIEDGQGKKKWTVWIPPASSFPLRPFEYAEICAQAEQIQLELNGGTSLLGKKKSYYHKDKTYVDVSEALSSGILPGRKAGTAASRNFEAGSPLTQVKKCEKSITFVMETEDAGMGNTLLAMWLTYGLAKKENRAFFIDDTRWPYGKYTDYFKAPSKADCRPPSSVERVPCPRSAHHLVVSAATFAFTYGPSFEAEFVDKSKSAKFQHHRINHLMRVGYKNLFQLADAGDAAYLHNRTRGDVYKSVKEGGGMTIGVHVRHGDLHPWEKEFHGDYLPITRYMNEVREILITAYEQDDETSHGVRLTRKPLSRIVQKAKAVRYRGRAVRRAQIYDQSDEVSNIQPVKRHAPAGFAASQVFLASDDPLVYNAPEMARLVRAQDRIVLASKADLDQMSGNRHKGPVDHVHGWEGGFFAAEFLSMGVNAKRIPLPARERLVGHEVQSETNRQLKAVVHGALSTEANGISEHPNQHQSVSEPTPAALQLRRIVGRAYLLDLAVIGSSDAVVCAVSSATCRVLGVMAGWDKIKDGGWHNVDGKSGWQGLVVK